VHDSRSIDQFRTLLPLIALLLIAGCQHVPISNITQFALIGDNPYQEYNFPKYARMIERINATPGIEFVVHVGDVKDGGTSCADEELGKVHAMHREFNAPFVLTPGDNDWFDCKRKTAGGWDRRERLAAFRGIFYAEPVDLPLVQQSADERYADYVENVYWVDEGVVYAAVHTIGVTGTEGGMDLHHEVLDTAVAWLDEVFTQAAAVDAKGVFIATQADPYPFWGDLIWLMSICDNCFYVRPGYEKLHEALVQHTRSFTGPVVLAVGDTHLFRIDKPLYDGQQLVSHFTRVEVFGENEVHWVRVVVDPDSSSVFSFHQELIQENLGTGWTEADKERAQQ
jgi:hypothetical protein